MVDAEVKVEGVWTFERYGVLIGKGAVEDRRSGLKVSANRKIGAYREVTGLVKVSCLIENKNRLAGCRIAAAARQLRPIRPGNGA